MPSCPRLVVASAGGWGARVWDWLLCRRIESRHPAAQQRPDDIAHQRDTQEAFDKLLIHAHKDSLVVEQRATRILPVYRSAGLQPADKAIRYGPVQHTTRSSDGNDRARVS